MKICVTAIDSKIGSKVDPRFGRCAYYFIFDEKFKLLKKIPNDAGQAMRGAGITAAQIVANEKVDVIITGNMGPNAYGVLSASNIKIFHGAFGLSVKQALKDYKDGKLQEINVSKGIGFGPGFGRDVDGRNGRGFGRRL
jgi:predicted Fe-Mo cluster-binding NifX family protein